MPRLNGIPGRREKCVPAKQHTGETIYFSYNSSRPLAANSPRCEAMQIPKRAKSANSPQPRGCKFSRSFNCFPTAPNSFPAGQRPAVSPLLMPSQRRSFKVFTIVPTLQLGQIGDDGDATCSGSSGGVLGIR